MNGRATDVAADEAEDNIPVLHVASTAASTPTIGSLPMGVCRLQLLPYRRRVAGEQSDRYTCGSGAVFWSFVCCVAWDVIVCAEVITAVGSSLVDVYSVTQPGWEAMNSAMVEKLFGKLAADAITCKSNTRLTTDPVILHRVLTTDTCKVHFNCCTKNITTAMAEPLEATIAEDLPSGDSHHHLQVIVAGVATHPRDEVNAINRRGVVVVAVARYYVMSTAAIGYGERQVLRTTKYPMDLDTGLILCVL
ncbi:hypothetical protein PC115_g16612 [Phytophthora cactorum]|uniref:Uncharacterized protein n=1 Tax=Phytophthora cactorum TaxID=29920 RepID=A0A8T1BCU0_9STRA|nr:hypothetical protein PC115_g16612 [Phytophthora cactorum]